MDPSKISVVGHGTLDEIMRNRIKERSDIQIDDPVGFPASLSRHAYRIECRAAGSIAVGVGVEMRFHQWLQDHLGDRLPYAIGNGWHTPSELHSIATGLWDPPKLSTPFIRYEGSSLLS